MNKALIVIAVVIFAACASQKNAKPNTATGNTRTKKVSLLNDNTYLLTHCSTDSTYAYTKENAVKVGGAKESSGPKNERRFLNALLGPNGEPVQYSRLGSCCNFSTPNGFMGGGLLDIYRVYWKGCTDTLSIYINMYDEGNLEVPVGLKAQGK